MLPPTSQHVRNHRLRALRKFLSAISEIEYLLLQDFDTKNPSEILLIYFNERKSMIFDEGTVYAFIEFEETEIL
jgi:hypothetical protein